MKSKSDKDWKNLSSKEKNNLKTTAGLLIGAIAIDLIKEHWENSTKSQKIRIIIFWLILIFIIATIEDFKEGEVKYVIGLLFLNIIWGVRNYLIRNEEFKNYKYTKSQKIWFVVVILILLVTIVSKFLGLS